jgi:hypothetical protein
MARLDLPDVVRDEDAHTNRRGGVTRSEFRDRALALEHEQLIDVVEAAFIVANALERLADGRRDAHPSTLAGLASTLQNGLRGSGGH